MHRHRIAVGLHSENIWRSIICCDFIFYTKESLKQTYEGIELMPPAAKALGGAFFNKHAAKAARNCKSTITSVIAIFI